MLKATILSSVITASVGVAGYGVWEGMKLVADNRYVQQKAWIDDNKNRDIRRIQYQIDELEFTRTQRPLTSKEQWELQRHKSEVTSIREGR